MSACINSISNYVPRYSHTVQVRDLVLATVTKNVTPEIRTQTLLSLMCQSVKVEKRELSVNS